VVVKEIEISYCNVLLITVKIESKYKDSIDQRSELVDDFIIKSLDEVSNDMTEPVKYLPLSGGKRLRPVIFLLTSEMFGVSKTRIVPIAAGLEALHTSSLIQDDHPIMDDDSRRRGVESVHKKYDEETAILASNILRSKATSWCTEADISKETLKSVIREMDEVVDSMCTGQKMDLEMEDQYDVSEEDYIDMITKKTASLYEVSAYIPSIISNEQKSTKNRISSFGQNLGLSFQVMDDVLDFKDNNRRSTEYSDIKNNKKTIVTLHAKRNGVPVFSSNVNLDRKIDLIRDSGSIDYAERKAQEYAEKSRKDLNSVKVEDEQKREILQEIVEFVYKRLN
jgi:geranylgeranyl diphosphate synthase type I